MMSKLKVAIIGALAGASMFLGGAMAQSIDDFDTTSAWYATSIDDNTTALKVAQLGAGNCAFRVEINEVVDNYGFEWILARMPSSETCATDENQPTHFWGGPISIANVDTPASDWGYYSTGDVPPRISQTESDDSVGEFAVSADGQAIRFVRTENVSSDPDITRTRIRIRILSENSGQALVETRRKSTQSWDTEATITLTRANDQVWSAYELPPVPTSGQRVCRSSSGYPVTCPPRRVRR